MSMSKPKVVFNGYSLWDFNSGNYALKNDFFENLVYIAAEVSAIINILPTAKLKEGFIPMKKMNNPDRMERYHGSGSAITLGIQSDVELIKTMLIDFISQPRDVALSAVVTEDSVRFVADGKGCLYEPTDTDYRVVWKSGE